MEFIQDGRIIAEVIVGSLIFLVFLGWLATRPRKFHLKPTGWLQTIHPLVLAEAICDVLSEGKARHDHTTLNRLFTALDNQDFEAAVVIIETALEYSINLNLTKGETQFTLLLLIEGTPDLRLHVVFDEEREEVRSLLRWRQTAEGELSELLKKLCVNDRFSWDNCPDHY